jgi:hypothetical protein
MGSYVLGKKGEELLRGLLDVVAALNVAQVADCIAQAYDFGGVLPILAHDVGSQ